MSDRLCPLCQSPDTGGYPKTRLYVERGRVDIDDGRCHACGASFEVWYYTREDMIEYHMIRRPDGSRETWTDLPPRQCRLCKSANVRYVGHDGFAYRRDVHVEILRYECAACAAVWLEYAQIDDGKRMFWRLWSGRR
jgi:hypothetical protein